MLIVSLRFILHRAHSLRVDGAIVVAPIRLDSEVLYAMILLWLAALLCLVSLIDV